MSGVVLALGSVLTVGATVWAAIAADLSAVAVALAGASGAAGSMVRMPSVRPGRSWTVAPMIVLTFGLLGTPAFPGPIAALAGVFVVEAAGTERPNRVEVALASSVTLLLLWAAAPFAAVPLTAPPVLAVRELGVVAAVGTAWFVVEAVLHARTAPSWGEARRFHFVRALGDWMIGLVAVSSAVTFAVLWPFSAGWAFAVSLVPLAIAFQLGQRVAAGRTMAEVTVKALGRLPEAAGLTQAGHAQFVADLAVAMGKLRGLIGPQLAELEVAAHLHDIGLLATTDKSVRDGGFFSSDVASWGADIMRESTTLNPAAAIVASSAEPFRVPGLDPDPALDARSQIVQVACLFVRRVEAGTSIEDAVEDLYQQSLYQLDPRIVALIRPATAISESVLDEVGRLHP